MTTTTAPQRRILSVPSLPVTFTAVWTCVVLVPILVFLGEILFTDHDPHATDGPVSSIVSIAVVSAVAVALGLGIGALSVGTPERARVGAIVLGALSVVTVVFFWSGAPGLIGVCAAWVAGLTKGGTPLGGAARAVGIVGLFVAALNIVLSIGGLVLAGAV